MEMMTKKRQSKDSKSGHTVSQGILARSGYAGAHSELWTAGSSSVLEGSR